MAYRGALMNARKVTLDDQDFLHGIDLLPAQAQQEVHDLATSLKEHHR
jgi:hypothetical protein